MDNGRASVSGSNVRGTIFVEDDRVSKLWQEIKDLLGDRASKTGLM
jgi:hypothetical protein